MSESGKAIFLSYASPCFAKATQGRHEILNCRSVLARDSEQTIACKQSPTTE
jgi:hypothetical protein